MDYPQLNLLLGLGLILAVVINIVLRILLSKMTLPAWPSRLSRAALAASLLASLYIESLFLRYMTATFNRQIAFGLFLIGGVGALVTAALRRRAMPSRLGVILLGAQLLASLISLFLALAAYRSLVPIPEG